MAAARIPSSSLNHRRQDPLDAWRRSAYRPPNSILEARNVSAFIQRQYEDLDRFVGNAIDWILITTPSDSTNPVFVSVLAGLEMLREIAGEVRLGKELAADEFNRRARAEYKRLMAISPSPSPSSSSSGASLAALAQGKCLLLGFPLLADPLPHSAAGSSEAPSYSSPFSFVPVSPAFSTSSEGSASSGSLGT